MSVSEIKLEEKLWETQSLFGADTLKDLFRPEFSRMSSSSGAIQVQNLQFLFLVSQKKMTEVALHSHCCQLSRTVEFYEKAFWIFLILNFSSGIEIGSEPLRTPRPGTTSATPVSRQWRSRFLCHNLCHNTASSTTPDDPDGRCSDCSGYCSDHLHKQA